jgi:hypothetical protein
LTAYKKGLGYDPTLTIAVLNNELIQFNLADFADHVAAT